MVGYRQRVQEEAILTKTPRDRRDEVTCSQLALCLSAKKVWTFAWVVI